MGLFSKLFPPSMGELPVKVDMHSHLLPGIDDGSQNVEDSISMIKDLMELGYEQFICTPHIMGDFFKNDRESITNAYNILKEQLDKENIHVPISFAAEYYIDEWFHEKINAENLLCLKDNIVLVETSYVNKPHNFRNVIFDLKSSGYDVVLAHPERYIYLYKNFDAFKELYELDIKFQINLNSLSGYYSPAAKKFAQLLVDNEMVDYVGTDCHADKHVKFLKKTMCEKHFKKLMNLNLLNDQLAK